MNKSRQLRISVLSRSRSSIPLQYSPASGWLHCTLPLRKNRSPEPSTLTHKSSSMPSWITFLVRNFTPLIDTSIVEQSTVVPTSSWFASQRETCTSSWSLRLRRWCCRRSFVSEKCCVLMLFTVQCDLSIGLSATCAANLVRGPSEQGHRATGVGSR